MAIITKKILDFFNKHPNQTWYLKDIKKHLNVSNSTELRHTLNNLVDKGKIVRTRKRAYSLPKAQSKNLLEGYLQITAQGYGFVLNEEGGPDMLIPEENLLSAWDGDRVAAHPFFTRGRPKGEIVAILKRKFPSMVGTLEYSRGYAILRPDEPRLRARVKLLSDSVGDLEAGSRVFVKLNWPEDTNEKEVFGEVIEKLGSSIDDSQAETRAVIIKHHLKDDFDEQTLAEAKVLPMEVTEKMITGRVDLRKIPTFTIDGVDAKDFDDALSLERVGGRGKKARYRVGIHIADVTHYVTEDSPLDKEARERTTSVYLPGYVLPMLPQELSNNICSLVEGKSRLSFSVITELDSEAEVKSVSFKKTVIKSNARLTYSEVQDFFEGQRLPLGKRKLERDLKQLLTLSQTLRKERLSQGALDFDFTESKIDFDQSGEMQVMPIRSNSARQLIEEFMLLANRLVAKELAQKDIPGLFRIHEEPSEKKLGELQKSLAKLGYTIDLNNYTPQTLQEIIAQAANKPERELVTTLLLRSLKQARYGPDNLGHFGLAFEHYLHFTSPIRRYPDLVVHRILYLSLKGKLTKKLKDHYNSELPQLAEHVSELERTAEEAERELTRYYQALWAKNHLDDVFEGTISGVNDFGFFVALTNGVEGLVPVTSLIDDQYIYHEDNFVLQGKKNNKTYKIGQGLKVCIANANPTAKQIDLIPLDTNTKEPKKAKLISKGKKEVAKKSRASHKEKLSLEPPKETDNQKKKASHKKIKDNKPKEEFEDHTNTFKELADDSQRESLPFTEQNSVDKPTKLTPIRKRKKRLLVFGKYRTKY